MNPIFYILGAVLIVVILVAWLAGKYNLLVRLKNRVRESWSQIDVQLRRRYDLIPNLVETVKGYASHERETLEAVIKARDGAMNALAEVAKASRGGIPTKETGTSGQPTAIGFGAQQPSAGPAGANPMIMLDQAEGLLAGALSRMQVTIERYPDLKANQNFMHLQEELVATENRVAFARQHYNEEVRQYQTRKESFPDNIVAGMFKFPDAAYFEETDPAKRDAPKVSFD